MLTLNDVILMLLTLTLHAIIAFHHSILAQNRNYFLVPTLLYAGWTSGGLLIIEFYLLFWIIFIAIDRACIKCAPIFVMTGFNGHEVRVAR